MTAATETDREITLEAATAAVRAEVSSWEGVEVERHSRGGIRFVYGRRELGHLHDMGPIADLPFPRRVRDELVAEGRARPHHVIPDSGWVTARMTTTAETENVIGLFRQSYERAREASARR